MPQLLFTTTAPVPAGSRNAIIKSVILPSLRTDLEHRYCSEEQLTLPNYCYFETKTFYQEIMQSYRQLEKLYEKWNWSR